jgi:hypothetical protein
MNKHVAPIALSVGLLGLVGGVAAAHAFQPTAKPAPAKVQLVQPAAETFTPTPTVTTTTTVAPKPAVVSRPKAPAPAPKPAVVPKQVAPAPVKSVVKAPAPRAGTRSAEAGRCE